MRQVTCVRALDPTLETESELFRTSTHQQVVNHSAFFKTTRETLTEAFFESVNAPSSPQSLQRPPLLTSTREKLNLVYKRERYDGLNYGQIIQLRAELLKNARWAIAVDPYFSWLQGRSVDNRLTDEVFGAYDLNKDGIVPIQTSTDPVELLFSNLEISGPSFLRPDASIVRVYRDLDPELSPDELRAAQTILNLHSMQAEVDLNLTEIFAQRQSVWTNGLVWDFARNLGDARGNYRQLLNLVRKQYSAFLPQEAFEEFRRLFRTQEPIVDTIRRVLLAEREKRAPDQKDARDFADFKTKWKITPAITGDRIFDLIRYTDSDSVTYEILLLRAFGERPDASHIEGLLRALRLIIEVGEVSGDQHRFSEYTGERIQANERLRY